MRDIKWSRGFRWRRKIVLMGGFEKGYVDGRESLLRVMGAW